MFLMMELGSFLDPSDVPADQPQTLPPAGSNPEWLSTLWCTVRILALPAL